MSQANTVSVWDPLVRLFHWVLAGAFFTAYISADEWLNVHTTAGYLVISIVLGRLLWGFIGSHHARFRDFVVGPRKTLAYIKAMPSRRHPRFLGHNPAGAVMILALLFSLAATASLGMITLGIEEHTGPLAGWVTAMGWHNDDLVEELHEFFANLTLFLVIFHIAGALLESWLHKENLVKAMLTGRKRETITE